MSDNIGKQLLTEGKRREIAKLTSQISSRQNRLFYSVTRLVPRPFQWIVPIVMENLKKSQIKLDKLPGVNKLKKSKRFTKLIKKLPKSVRDKFAGELETQETELNLEETMTEEAVKPRIVKPLYVKYACEVGNPLFCDFPQQTVEQIADAKSCQKCRFPALLAPETKIRGSKEIYQIDNYLGHRGIGRFYQAVQISNQEALIIKEYLLPKRYFSPTETRQLKEIFLRIGGFNLADNRFQDFRLILPSEAIADANQERCYLVYHTNLYTAPTLASYLEQTGAMTSREVYQVLSQVLQSLDCLHRQKFRLRSGLVRQGIPHGNLNLETLIIVPNLQGFFIYLCDPALWEDLFYPEPNQVPARSLKQDLKDLGNLAFYLLAGDSIDRTMGYPLDPMLDANWPESVNPELKNFIFNLMELGDSLPYGKAERLRDSFASRQFDSAEMARLALLKISVNLVEKVEFTEVEKPVEEKKKRNWRQILLWIVGISSVLLVGYLIWFFLVRDRSQIKDSSVVCCVDRVSGFPTGIFSYTAKQNDTWHRVLLGENLIRQGTTLQEELAKRLNPPAKDGQEPPQIQLIYLPQASATDAIAKVRNREAYFAISNLVSVEKFYRNLIYRDLDYKIIGYDSLVFFVAFGYNQRENSIPTYLNGQITFEQLRQLYTGKITNWQELGGPDMPVKLYIPNQPEAVELFEDVVLQDRNLIREFQALQKSQQSEQQANSFVQIQPAISQPNSMTELLRGIIGDFEQEQPVGAIAFGPFSQVFNQCSVYPLALQADQKTPISPLIQNNQQPITPANDLCNNKGSYGPNLPELISQRYPLVYPLALVYLKDNRLLPVGQKFGEVMRTVEMQRLLTQTGLIPIKDLSIPRQNPETIQKKNSKNIK
ncbi:substrate-binding domain-containing protein [Planktothricoides sp. SR001]|uniref:substrate-binding domain-containing protein n=1 Tax=Planktothricoides sp. SR001 TaxID=1705388 RepID=UPI0006C8E0FD|nr:substrate-binding domain-containing protein [Planktothricoides sp. SR001]